MRTTKSRRKPMSDLQEPLYDLHFGAVCHRVFSVDAVGVELVTQLLLELLKARSERDGETLQLTLHGAEQTRLP